MFKLTFPPFVPGETYIPVAQQTLSGNEAVYLSRVAQSGHFSAGEYSQQFEKALSGYLGMDYACLCNSGSSANLLAVSALKISRGGEVILPAAIFPTTLNPILQCGLVPVFVDIQEGTYNPSMVSLEGAISKKTRAVVACHTLGNPCDMKEMVEWSMVKQLWLIEDNCDALGSTLEGKLTGSFGDVSTLSFYPAHHISTGEGGAVFSRYPRIHRSILSLRDWGRDCTCPPGVDNLCRKRFSWKMGDLPLGYDHKYIYSHIGYNFKPTDMMAAVGLGQMEILEEIIAARKRNFQLLYEGVKDLEEFFELPVATRNSSPSWFGFPLTLRPPWERRKVVYELEKGRIGTRMLFAGNILRHPAYAHIPHRKAEVLYNTDRFMDSTFWIGVHPGLDQARIDYMIEALHRIIRESL